MTPGDTLEAPEMPARRRYRTFLSRIFAGVLDGIVLVPLSFILDPGNFPIRGPFTDFVLGTLTSIIAILYSVLLHARYGQTLGKMYVGVKVMDVSETRLPSLRQAFLRDIGEIVIDCAMVGYAAKLLISGPYASGDEYESTFWNVVAYGGLAWTLLEIITMLTNSKRRAVHDFIAGTVVVRTTRGFFRSDEQSRVARP